MTPQTPFPLGPTASSAAPVGLVLAAMAVVVWIETAIPLHARGRWNRAHLRPNLALTFIAFATNALLNAALVMALTRLSSLGFGLLNAFPLRPWLGVAAVVLALDFSSYAAHVAMHKIPTLWRFHRVHHCDPAVDVTTAIRQHPGEGLIRYAFMAAFAIALGAGAGAVAVYRVASALSALLEHANVRLPLWIDRLLSLVVTWPGVHKVHHSRDPRYTDTNYGNLVSVWDRLFATFTPVERGAKVAYGLDGFDDPAAQTTAGLLALPFRDAVPAGGLARRAAARAGGAARTP
jgi:sterol desaturase/sphingolipid hydroxylase (fatty acid hydroxylase superfamily)